MKSLMERIAQGEVLISDGAMGTFLHAKGLGPGECPESWCISHPGAVKEIAEAPAEQLYETFMGQVTALAEGGADVICVETMSSLVEAVQAKAAKENTKLPVICTFTFDRKPRGFFTMMGVTPEQAAGMAASAGADIVGANCGNGIANMIQISRRMRAALPEIPIIIQANAGMPKVEDGKTVFRETPEYMAVQVKELIESGVNIIGGCCGTSPDHIAAMAKASRAMFKAAER